MEKLPACTTVITVVNEVECEGCVVVECKSYEMLDGCWVGMYQPNCLDKQYIDYRYMSRLNTEGEIFIAIVTFQVPPNIGDIEFRSFKKNYLRTGISKPVNVVYPKFSFTHEERGGKIYLQVTMHSDIPHPYAWVGLYEKDKSDRNYTTYFLLNTAEKVFTTPKVPWHFRIFIRDYTRCAIYPDDPVSDVKEIKTQTEQVVLNGECPGKDSNKIDKSCSEEHKESFIIQLTDEEEASIVGRLNNQNISTIKLTFGPVYGIDVTPEQAKNLEKWKGVDMVIQDRVIPAQI